MAVTRRQFVRVSTVAAAGLSLTGSLAQAAQKGKTALAQVPIETMFDPRFRLNMALFADQVNTSFSLRSEAGKTAVLTLVRVENQTPPTEKRIGAAWEERFSLIFYASTKCPLAQGPHEARHAALGSFPLFVVPSLSASPARKAYVATFNRYVPGETPVKQTPPPLPRR